MWIESLCNDDKIIETNIRITKLSSPDYKDVDSDIVTVVYKLLVKILGDSRFQTKN